MSDEGGFCVICNFQVKSFNGLNSCPNCGTKSLPCSADWQVNGSINWHEMRILCMWAENWWNKHVNDEKTNPVFSIAARIRKQHPELAKYSPLTMAGEVQQVVDQFGPDVQHNVPGVEGGKPLKGPH